MAGSAYPVLPVTMEKSQFQTVKQERQLTQSRQRWEQPNTGRADSTQPQNSLWRGENCTRLAQLIRSFQCLWHFPQRVNKRENVVKGLNTQLYPVHESGSYPVFGTVNNWNHCLCVVLFTVVNTLLRPLSVVCHS